MGKGFSCSHCCKLKKSFLFNYCHNNCVQKHKAFPQISCRCFSKMIQDLCSVESLTENKESRSLHVFCYYVPSNVFRQTKIIDMVRSLRETIQPTVRRVSNMKMRSLQQLLQAELAKRLRVFLQTRTSEKVEN